MSKIPQFNISIDAAEVITTDTLKWTKKNLLRDNKRLKKIGKEKPLENYQVQDLTDNLRIIGAIDTILDYYGEL